MQGSMKVLVVEDEELVRALAVEALEEGGFEVIEATTGEEALDRCKECHVDVLFTDITLPGKLDGWDLAEHWRTLSQALSVVYATGYSGRDERRVPGSSFLKKPY